jgi:hypothetical protein
MKTSITPLFCNTLLLTIGLTGCANHTSQTASSAYPDNQPIQQITDKAVADARKLLNPKGISIVVAEPKTGKILAISDWPYWPPKAIPNPRTGKPAPNLWTTSKIFEHGNTFSRNYRINYWTEKTIQETPAVKPDQSRDNIVDVRPVGDEEVLLTGYRSAEIAALGKERQFAYLHAIDKDERPNDCGAS